MHEVPRLTFPGLVQDTAHQQPKPPNLAEDAIFFSQSSKRAFDLLSTLEDSGKDGVGADDIKHSAGHRTAHWVTTPGTAMGADLQ